MSWPELWPTTYEPFADKPIMNPRKWRATVRIMTVTEDSVYLVVPGSVRGQDQLQVPLSIVPDEVLAEARTIIEGGLPYRTHAWCFLDYEDPAEFGFERWGTLI